MAIDPEELLPRKNTPKIVIGQDISALLVIELEQRISALQGEITRSEEALKARAATKKRRRGGFQELRYSQAAQILLATLYRPCLRLTLMPLLVGPKMLLLTIMTVYRLRIRANLAMLFGQ